MGPRSRRAGSARLRVGAAALACLAAGAAGLAAPASVRAERSAGAGCALAAEAGNESLADAVVALVNEHRGRLGLRPLRVAPALTRAAAWKASHMAQYRYLSHVDRGGRSPEQRLRACGWRSGWWGENIAYGYRTPAAVMAGWLASPGHRQNIERPHWTAIGVAAVRSRDGVVYWAQEFGGRA